VQADVVIIGAGPGGGMAANRLADSGLRVLVLEKEGLPRDKACGGAIPLSVTESLPFGLSAWAQHKVFVLRYRFNYGPAVHMNLRTPVVMVDRRRFDYQLILAAVKAGCGRVRVLDNFLVSDIIERRAGVTIYSKNGQNIQADYLIAADGALGKSALRLGLDTGASNGMAIDATVEMTSEAFLAQRGMATFNYNCVPYGYGWIFPKNGYLSCGVSAWRKPFPTVETLYGFLHRSLSQKQIRSVQAKAHPVPFYNGHHRLSTPRTCLVGDAARLVDPITGEGIRFALLSGAMAAEAVLTAGRSRCANTEGKQGMQIYTQTIHQTIGKDLDLMYRLVQPVFLEAPELFDRRFVCEGCDYVALYRKLDEKINNRKMKEPF
jgi:geranylgeranyl reductase family protein